VFNLLQWTTWDCCVSIACCIFKHPLRLHCLSSPKANQPAWRLQASLGVRMCFRGNHNNHRHHLFRSRGIHNIPWHSLGLRSENFDSKVTDGHLVSLHHAVLAGLIISMEVCVNYSPFFFCINTRHKRAGNLIGLVYACYW
jgi:hypothetical protein